VTETPASGVSLTDHQLARMADALHLLCHRGDKPCIRADCLWIKIGAEDAEILAPTVAALIREAVDTSRAPGVALGGRRALLGRHSADTRASA
jgi:hypothetical protein